MPYTPPYKRSPAQRRQQQLRQALGTTIGFAGYLNHLQQELSKAVPGTTFPSLESLKKALPVYASWIRTELKTIPKPTKK